MAAEYLSERGRVTTGRTLSTGELEPVRRMPLEGERWLCLRCIQQPGHPGLCDVVPLVGIAPPMPFAIRPQPKPTPKPRRPRKPGKRTVRVRKLSAKRPAVDSADLLWKCKVRDEWELMRVCGATTCARCYEAAKPAIGDHDVHHVFGMKAHPALRHEPSNGIVLCRMHHTEAHHRVGWFRRWFAKRYPDRGRRLEAARRKA